MIEKAIEMITEQQKGKENTAPWFVGEQLKDICRDTPGAAELVVQDLKVKEMSISECEKKIKALADERHRLKAEAEQAVADGKKREIAAAVAEVKNKLDETEAELKKTGLAAKEAERRVRELEKKLMLSDPAASEFRTLFNQMQDISHKARQSLSNIRDEELREKFGNAVRQFAAQLSKV